MRFIRIINYSLKAKFALDKGISVELRQGWNSCEDRVNNRNCRIRDREASDDGALPKWLPETVAKINTQPAPTSSDSTSFTTG